MLLLKDCSLVSSSGFSTLCVHTNVDFDMMKSTRDRFTIALDFKRWKHLPFVFTCVFLLHGLFTWSGFVSWYTRGLFFSVKYPSSTSKIPDFVADTQGAQRHEDLGSDSGKRERTLVSNHFLQEPLQDKHGCEYDNRVLSSARRFDEHCGKEWRIALSLRGKKPNRCNEHLDRFIWSLPNVDIYVHSWSMAVSDEEFIMGRYHPAEFLIENISVVDSSVALFEHIEGAPRQASTHVPFLWGISKGLQLVAFGEEERNKTYDLVASLRWDLGQDHIGPITFPWLCPLASKLYSQFGPELNWAFYDQWFYSSSHNMRRMSGILDALINGELYPLKGQLENEFTRLVFDEGVPFSDRDNYWSNVVLSNRNTRNIAPMTSSNRNSDIRNIHLVFKIFLVRLGLFDADNAMYCTDKTFEDFWRRRQLPEHGFFPWSNNPPESSPNCVGADSQFSHDHAKSMRGVRA